MSLYLIREFNGGGFRRLTILEKSILKIKSLFYLISSLYTI